jgi:serine/threonine protein kinase
MGAVFNIVGCECSKKLEKQPSIKKIKVTDYTSHVLISSTIIPKELYTDKKQGNEKAKKKKISKKIENNVNEKYIQICILGKSHYSTVYKVKNKLNNQLRAMKEIPKENIENANDTKNIVFSINILTNLRHPNLIQLYEFYEDDKNFYIIYDLCEQVQLHEILKDKCTLPEFIVKYIIYKILLATDHLHKQRIIHGDIKIKNIGFINVNRKINKNFDEDKILGIKELINITCDDVKLKNELLTKNDYENLSKQSRNFINNLMNFEVVLMDCWSQDVFIKNIIDKNNIDIMSNISYFAPELFNQNITKERDEWAIGILLFNLINGYMPFEGDTKEELVYDIINKDIDNEINELNIGKECKDLLFKLLNKNPHYRIKAEEALKHEFFKKGIKIKDLMKLKNSEI